MIDFPNEKWPSFRNTFGEFAIVDGLRRKTFNIAPAEYEWLCGEVTAENGSGPEGIVRESVNPKAWRSLPGRNLQKATQADGLIEISWRGKKTTFTVEIKSTSTPRILEMAIFQAKSAATSQNPPLVIVPYLSEESMKTLEANGVSGFDLCGNVVILGGGFYIWRGGQPNLYPENRPIKNVYRGRGSVFARCFLLRTTFDSLADLREFAIRRLEPKYQLGPQPTDINEEARLATSTASKVVSALAEDLIVQRRSNAIELIDASALVRNLKSNFSPLGPPLLGKTSLSNSEVWTRLRASVERGEIRAATTGLGAAAHYGALATESKISIRASDIGQVTELLELTPTRAFPNVEIFEDANDETALFDCRLDKGILWASPIQTLLELATGGPRERDAAEKFEARLLERAESSK